MFYLCYDHKILKIKSFALKILLVGCGDIGTRVADHFAHTDCCFGLRRDTTSLRNPIIPIEADVLNKDLMISVLSENFDVVIITLTPDGLTESDYKKTYFEGATSIKTALNSMKKKPKLVIWVSSTRVYRYSSGRNYDEKTPLVKADAYVSALIEAEEEIKKFSGKTIVLRFSGIYGAERPRLLDSVRAGYGCHKLPERWTNRIHIDDCVRILIHLINKYFEGFELDDMYIGTDSFPVTQYELRTWLANRLKIKLNKNTKISNKGCKLSNTRLLNSGFKLNFPSYQEGYEMILKQEL